MDTEMSQLTISSQGASQPRYTTGSEISFMDLPVNVRHQIYTEVPLEVGWAIRMRSYRKSINGAYSSCRRSCRNLLLTCRAVNADVTAFLISNNHLYIMPSDFPHLESLGPVILASMKDITVQLGVCTCQELQCCKEHDLVESGHCIGHFGTEEYVEILRNKTAMDIWKQATAFLTSQTNPSTLRLRIICDTPSADYARLCLSPLRDMRAAACTIRLAKSQNADLRALALETASRIIGRPAESTTQPFRFMDLPPELRRQILEYTDLVTPSRGVQWMKQMGYHPLYNSLDCGEGECGPEEIHHECQFRRCWRRTTSGCFCSLQHTVFPPCRCWQPPTALFFVSREMRQVALAVFYGHNKFAVSCNESLQRRPRPCEQLEVSTWLSKIMPADGLHYLRNFTIEFWPSHPDCFEPQDIAFRDLMHTLNRVGPALKLTNLRVIIWNSLPHPLHIESGKTAFDVSTMPPETIEALHMNEMIIFPFYIARDIDSFEIELFSNHSHAPHEVASVQRSKAALAEHLKRVMRGGLDYLRSAYFGDSSE